MGGAAGSVGDIVLIVGAGVVFAEVRVGDRPSVDMATNQAYCSGRRVSSVSMRR
jgi:hypothetical protein